MVAVKPPPLRKYQRRGVSFLEKNEGRGAIFLKPGAGKTAIVLTYLKRWFKKNKGERILLIAPRSVIYDAWEFEPLKWSPGIKVRNIHRDGYADGYDLYTINFERFSLDVNASKKYLRGFSGLVVDESTGFKSPSSKRTKNYHRIIDVCKFAIGIILTGTPITRNLLDIYCPYYLVDKTKLGRNFYIFRSHFFEPTPDGRSWLLKEDSEEEIIRRLSYRSFILTEKEEKEIGYPQIMENDLYFKLSPKNWKRYAKFHDEMLLELDEMEIDRTKYKGKLYQHAISYGYCTQFTSGHFYEQLFTSIEDPKNPGEYIKKKTGTKVHHLHDERLEVLKDLLDVLNGEPIFILYHFTSDLESFKKLGIKKSKIIRGGMKPTEIQAILGQWNAGAIPALFAQIGTVSHGLNLQFGGSHICYYNMPDDYDKYYQSLHRLVRPGQKKKQVTIHRIICRYTVDEINRLQILNRKIINAAKFKKLLQGVTKN
jgi:SNF2 family DNA or RNA helicase